MTTADDNTTQQVDESGAIELSPARELSPAAEAMKAQAMATVQARVALAVARPRDVLAFRDKLIKECKRPAFADAAIFSKPTGGRTLEGASIRFAEACLRLYGNLLVEVTAVSSDKDGVLLRATATDLESNSTDTQDLFVARAVERKNPAGREVLKTRRNSSGEPTYTVEATDDEMLTEVNKNASKLRRNRILAMIPGDIIEDAMKQCNATCNDRDAKDPLAAIKQLVDAFSALGVSPPEVKEYLGHDVERVTPKELSDLRAVYNALKSGETNWRDAMEAKGLGAPPAAGKGVEAEHKGTKSERMGEELKRSK